MRCWMTAPISTGASCRIRGTSEPARDELGRAHDARPNLCHARSGRTQEAQLLEGRHAIVETNLLGDLAVLDAKHGRSREVHLAAGPGRQRPDEKIAERRASVRAAALPTTDHAVALGDEVRGAVELEIGERLAEA